MGLFVSSYDIAILLFRERRVVFLKQKSVPGKLPCIYGDKGGKFETGAENYRHTDQNLQMNFKTLIFLHLNPGMSLH